MDLYELRLFLHLSTTLHFARSSAACNISPSALSRTIQRLEEELGAELFVRDTRRVELSPAGRTVAAYARETVARYEQLRAELAAEAPEVRGEVTLFCSVTAAQSLLSPILARFRDRYPQVVIRILTGDSADAIERVAEGGADVSVAARPESLPAALRFHELEVTPLLFIAPRDEGAVADTIARVEAGRTALWNRVPLILADRALSRRYAERWFRAQGLRPHIDAEVAGHEAIIAMVRLGVGVGVVPRLVLEQSALASQVRVVGVNPALPHYHVGLCTHRRRLANAPVAAFWETAVSATE